MTRMRLTFDEPNGMDIGDLLEAIAEEVASGDTDGRIADGDAHLRWDMRETGGGIEIDRRQRRAAALLLMAFDLPQEMGAASRSMLEAADVCPGMTTGDMAPMNEHGRRTALEMARDLVAEMLAEIPGTTR